MPKHHSLGCQQPRRLKTGSKHQLAFSAQGKRAGWRRTDMACGEAGAGCSTCPSGLSSGPPSSSGQSPVLANSAVRLAARTGQAGNGVVMSTYERGTPKQGGVIALLMSSTSGQAPETCARHPQNIECACYGILVSARSTGSLYNSAVGSLTIWQCALGMCTRAGETKSCMSQLLTVANDSETTAGGRSDGWRETAGSTGSLPLRPAAQRRRLVGHGRIVLAAERLEGRLVCAAVATGPGFRGGGRPQVRRQRPRVGRRRLRRLLAAAALVAAHAAHAAGVAQRLGACMWMKGGEEFAAR